MIPREEHLKQINRFHDLVCEIDRKIQTAQGDEKIDLLQKYFKLTAKIWPKLDTAIDNLKIELDSIEKY